MTVQLSGMGEFLAAVDRARSISLASYVLSAGPLVRALETAGDRGASVAVTLAADPVENDAKTLGEQNRSIAQELERHHVSVELATRQTHLKAAVVDGRAFLDDRNWADDRTRGDEPSTVLVDTDPDDVRVVEAGIAGRAGSDAQLWMRKLDALDAEASLVQEAGGDRIEVESESFGFGAVERALETKARAGNDVRLIVCEREAERPREAAALRRLAAAGVQIRLSRFDEKIAVAGTQAWAGSANACVYPPDMVDWGMRTGAFDVVDALRARFDQNWNKAKAFASVVATTSSSDVSKSVVSNLAVSAT
jgi:hypothetical protein